jgi:hypothetical protein
VFALVSPKALRSTQLLIVREKKWPVESNSPKALYNRKTKLVVHQYYVVKRDDAELAARASLSRASEFGCEFGWPRARGGYLGDWLP